MKTLSEKVVEQRGRLGLSQKDLAVKAGIGLRSITAYEAGNATPRAAQFYKLAKALEVSPEYLKKDNIEDPSYGLDRMEYVEQMCKDSGTKEAHDLEAMLAENQALFSGGSISEEAKDAYFRAVMKAYLEYKEATRETFGRKKKESE